jgi:hypothetical protein
MITCYLSGGLGNQLFQIAAVIHYAIENNHSFYFTNAIALEGITPRHTYWDTFLKRLQILTVPIDFNNSFLIKELGFSYNTLPVIIPNKENEKKITVLSGYFQSHKYFEKNEKTFFKFLDLDEQQQSIKEKYGIQCENSVGIHFRLGDYKKLQHIHPIISNIYYHKSLNELLQRKSIQKAYIFCENDPDDIQHVKNVLQNIDIYSHNIEVIFVSDVYKGMADWEELLYMSLCENNIIANSTFSWWGAYLNRNSDKVVCYPSVWFGHGVDYDTKDLCPPSWLKITV